MKLKRKSYYWICSGNLVIQIIHTKKRAID